jgi:hypothetical protein
MRPRLLLCLLCCLPGLARADVLPPDLAAIYLKARENPKAYDRADQFCDGRSIGSPCEIPGNPFEGGGSGHCTQDINSASRSLDALCKLDDPPLIDRQTPEGGFQVSKELCDMASKNPDLASNLRSMDVRCDLPPATLTPDRFCQGRKPGDACQVQLRQADRNLSFAGRCTEETQERRFYIYGNRYKQRQVLLCQPEHPVIRDYRRSSPPGWLKKLFE